MPVVFVDRDRSGVPLVLGFGGSMTNYQTISNGNRRDVGTASNMARHQRGRSSRDGGGQASMLSSNINLVNTVVGAGTLAMPHALSNYGIIMGVLLILWCGFTSAFGLYLQARCARYLDRGSTSFFALSKITYPNAAVVFDAAIAVKCFGVGVSYMIIIADLMPGVMKGFNSRAADIPFLVDRNFWITGFMLLIIPLSFLRRLDSLKYTSLIALVSIGYLIILVVYHFAADTVPDKGPIRVIGWNSPVAALSSLPVVIFAYTCHQNMFSILNEIKDNSPTSIVGVITTSIGSAASIYILVAVAGYMTFGDKVVGNIVSMYSPNVASTIGKAAIVVLVTFSIPLQIHPCRASIDAILKWRPHGGAQLDTHGTPILHMSDLRFALITTALLVSSYATALSVTSLDRVLAYVGSTGSTSISFILPGLFYYKISDPNSIHHQRLTKEDDDTTLSIASSDDEEGLEPSSSALLEDVAALHSTVAGVAGGGPRPQSRWRRRWRWRWDMEHIEAGLLRKLSLCLAVYGLCVMGVSLVLNTFMVIAH